MCFMSSTVSHMLPILLFQLAQEVTGSSRVPVWLSRRRPELFPFFNFFFFLPHVPFPLSFFNAPCLITRSK